MINFDKLFDGSMLIAGSAPNSWVPCKLTKSGRWIPAARGSRRATTTTHRRTSNPRRTRHRGAATRASVRSGDSNTAEPEPEPDRHHRLYSFKSLAHLLDCAAKTLRNKVSSGAIPRPIPTISGPRFTSEQVGQILSGTTPDVVVAPKRGKGRPRIAASGKGVRHD